MLHTEDLAQIEGLIDQLVEAQRSIDELVGGQGDAVLHPATAIPSLLHDAQQWLWAAESHLQLVQQAVAVGILIINADTGVISSANRAARELISIPEESIGSSYAARLQRMVDKDGSAFQPGQDPIEIALATRKFVPSTVTGVRDRHGRLSAWLLVTCEPVNAPAGGPAEEIVVTIVDITQQQLAGQLAQRRADQQRSVAYLGELASERINLSALCAAAVSKVSAVLGVDYCELLEFVPASREFVFKAAAGWEAGLVNSGTVKTADSQAGYTLASTGPVIVDDMRTEKRFASAMQLGRGIVSGVTVLVPDGAEAFGVLGAHTTQQRSFTQDDINFLQSVANVLAAAIQRSRSEETIRLLSTPVLPVKERLLLLPLVGAIDAERAMQLTSDLLEAVRQHRAKVVVLDITGVSSLDRFVAQSLLDAIGAAHLLGARVIVTGISADTTKTWVSLGLGLDRLTTAGDLRGGLDMGERLLS